jgi:hypothetical protein
MLKLIRKESIVVLGKRTRVLEYFKVRQTKSLEIFDIIKIDIIS